MRRRAERLRDIWSDEVRFSALEEEDGEPGAEDDEDWQVTFSDRVSYYGDSAVSYHGDSLAFAAQAQCCSHR